MRNRIRLARELTSLLIERRSILTPPRSLPITCQQSSFSNLPSDDNNPNSVFPISSATPPSPPSGNETTGAGQQPRLKPREVPPPLESSLPPLSNNQPSTAEIESLSSASISAIGTGGTTFNTSRYAQMLQAEGFTSMQSDAVLQLVTEAVSESMENVVRSMVTKAEQSSEIADAEQDFAQLRCDIQMLEKRDFAVLRGELERIMQEVERMKLSMREEVSRVHGGVRLDINLEKARIQDEAAELKDMVKKAEARIDEEIELLTQRMIQIREGTKASLKQFMGIAFTAFCVYKIINYTTQPKK
ncbi:hypothetical protein PhCBS80983_g03864 [Powellomyces hirtus]|uniref:DUF1640 domain-containing protein n=1 Tax=Powellomyces hirtus TaxID=109895 RepID=A0A507E248_9FUNG|nr:hypothetical protein PhCBS80983_g03864 [Powellomyces hirtus]